MPSTLQNVQRLRTVGILFMLAGIGCDSLLHWPYAVIIPIFAVALFFILLSLRIARRAQLQPEPIPFDQRHKRFLVLLLALLVALVAGYFLMRHTDPELPVVPGVVISLFSFLVCVSIFAWKIYYPRTPNLTGRSFLKSKLGRFALLLFLTLGGVFSVYIFAHLVPETHVQFIGQGLGAAWTESQKLPPGFARGEDFLRRLKAINTDHAPPELKQALSDYIAACEKGLIAMEAGRDAPAESKAMAEARERMIAIERKYR